MSIEKHVYSAQDFAKEIAKGSTKSDLENLSKEMRAEEAQRIVSAISTKHKGLEIVISTAIAKKKMPAPDGTPKKVPMTQEYFANKVQKLQKEGKTDELLTFTSSVNKEVDRYIKKDFNYWEKLKNFTIKTGEGFGELGKDTWKGMKTTPVERRVRNATGLGISSWYVASIFLGPGRGRLLAAGIAAVSAGLIPKSAVLGMKAVEIGLEGAGKLVFGSVSRIEKTLVDVIHGDADNIGNIKDYLRTNKLSSERLRDKISGFYDQGIDVLEKKPELIPNELRPIFAKVFEKSSNSKEEEQLSSEEIITSAKFCLKGFDSAHLSKGEIEQMKNLDQWKDWPPEVFQKIRTSLLTAEAGYLFHYFMVKASDTERTKFIENFTEMIKSKKDQKTMTADQLVSLPEKFKNLQGYTTQELRKIFPQFNEQDPKIMRALQKQPAGIRYGMEKSDLIKGGAVVGLIAWGIGIITFYTSKFLLGDKKSKEKNKKTPEGKYEKKRKEANRQLVILLDREEIGKRHWKQILAELENMSVLHKKEVKKLKKGYLGIIGIKKDQWTKIFKEMKKPPGWVNKVGSSKLSDIAELQGEFWKCVKDAGVTVSDYRSSKIGSLAVKKTIGTGETTEKRTKAFANLKMFKGAREEYDKFLAEQTEAYQIRNSFFIVFAGIGNGLRKFSKNAEKFKKHLEKRKNMRGGSKYLRWFTNTLLRGREHKGLLDNMKILGVHENELKYLKKIPEKNGERLKAIYAQVDDLLNIYDKLEN